MPAPDPPAEPPLRPPADPAGAARWRRLRGAALAAADRVRGRPPLSVRTAGPLPPGVAPGDYHSTGIYWWPDPASADGLPWVRRDGERNPATADAATACEPRLSAMVDRVETLALAWRLTGRPVDARAAAEQLRAWFLDPATRMNPHLKHGQAVPGVSGGRPFGIIETRYLPSVLDASASLRGSADWSVADAEALRAWAAAYLTWLLDSQLGQEAAGTVNNHALWFDAQAAAFAVRLGDTDAAARLLQAFPQRLGRQLAADGSLPEELARTRSLSYSAMSVEAMLRAAESADRLVLEPKSPAVRGHPDAALDWRRAEPGTPLARAIHFVLPHVQNAAAWPHEQVTEPEPEVLRYVLLAGSARLGLQPDPADLDPLLARDTRPRAFDF